jgi:hypothetical protein
MEQAETETISYAQQVRMKWADDFLGNLLERPPIKQSGLEKLFREAAVSAYNTTFTDDSDYIYDGIGFMALKDIWDADPSKREAIKCGLDHFFGGNWIVKEYVRDIAKVIGLAARYA